MREATRALRSWSATATRDDLTACKVTKAESDIRNENNQILFKSYVSSAIVQ